MFNFSPLWAQYPGVIEKMPPVFSAHQFIRELARRNQTLYAQALAAYSHSDEPFRVVHGVLISRLHRLTDLVQKEDARAASANVFGNPGSCSRWRRVDTAAKRLPL